MNRAQTTIRESEPVQQLVPPTSVPPSRKATARVQTTHYALHHDGRDIALRSLRHDHAALEALHLLGARLVSNRPRRGTRPPRVAGGGRGQAGLEHAPIRRGTRRP